MTIAETLECYFDVRLKQDRRDLSGNDLREKNQNVFICWRNTDKKGDDSMSNGKEFQCYSLIYWIACVVPERF